MDDKFIETFTDSRVLWQLKCHQVLIFLSTKAQFALNLKLYRKGPVEWAEELHPQKRRNAASTAP